MLKEQNREKALLQRTQNKAALKKAILEEKAKIAKETLDAETDNKIKLDKHLRET